MNNLLIGEPILVPALEHAVESHILTGNWINKFLTFTYIAKTLINIYANSLAVRLS